MPFRPFTFASLYAFNIKNSQVVRTESPPVEVREAFAINVSLNPSPLATIPMKMEELFRSKQRGKFVAPVSGISDLLSICYHATVHIPRGNL